jgi:zinc transport system ATP-binding protein
VSTALACRDVCIDIEASCILSNVNLDVESGEFVAVLGANGSGKTTLMRAILGLLPITSGQIDVFGTPIGRFREWGRLAYVPQRLHSRRWVWPTGDATDSTPSPAVSNGAS